MRSASWTVWLGCWRDRSSIPRSTSLSVSHRSCRSRRPRQVLYPSSHIFLFNLSNFFKLFICTITLVHILLSYDIVSIISNDNFATTKWFYSCVVLFPYVMDDKSCLKWQRSSYVMYSFSIYFNNELAQCLLQLAT